MALGIYNLFIFLNDLQRGVKNICQFFIFVGMISEKLSIKHWAEDDRPREKLLKQGARALSDAELLAIILGSGSRDESAVELARRILAQYDNSLDEFGRSTIADLIKFKGVGEAKAINMLAVTELGRRRKEQEPKKRVNIKSSQDVAELLLPLLADLPIEEFWVLLLNQRNDVIQKHRVSIGGISGTFVDVRVVMKLAVEAMATGIILVHNHPSGTPHPSKEDKGLTKQIQEAAKYLDFRVLDHLIIFGNNYYSFADEGIL